MNLRQDGTYMGDDESDDDNSEKDDTEKDSFAGTNGAQAITLKDSQRNTLFLNLIDSF